MSHKCLYEGERICSAKTQTHRCLCWTLEELQHIFTVLTSAVPCRQYLDQEVALSEDMVHKYSDMVLAKLNKTIGDLRRVFLVEDLVDSIKVSLKARVSLQVSRSSAHSSPRMTWALLFEAVLMSGTCTDLLRVQVSVQAALQLSGAVVALLSPSHPPACCPNTDLQLSGQTRRRDSLRG